MMAVSKKFPLSRAARGFTLLELLVVIFIIGLISGFVVLKINQADDNRLLQQEATRAMQSFRLAAQEAVIQGRPVGVRIEMDRYHFVVPTQIEWKKISETGPLGEHHLPRDWQLRLVDTDNEVLNTNTGTLPGSSTPHLLFFPTGEMQPFTLLFEGGNSAEAYQLQGELNGQISIQDRADKL